MEHPTLHVVLVVFVVIEVPPADGSRDNQSLREARLDAEEERAAGVAASLLLPRAHPFMFYFESKDSEVKTFYSYVYIKVVWSA